MSDEPYYVVDATTARRAFPYHVVDLEKAQHLIDELRHRLVDEGLGPQTLSRRESFGFLCALLELQQLRREHDLLSSQSKLYLQQRNQLMEAVNLEIASIERTWGEMGIASEDITNHETLEILRAAINAIKKEDGE